MENKKKEQMTGEEIIKALSAIKEIQEKEQTVAMVSILFMVVNQALNIFLKVIGIVFLVTLINYLGA